MIEKILIIAVILYLLAALYFGIFKKYKFFRILFKIVIFIVIVGIALALFAPELIPGLIK